jgi:hypothetical protein
LLLSPSSALSLPFQVQVLALISKESGCLEGSTEREELVIAAGMSASAGALRSPDLFPSWEEFQPEPRLGRQQGFF